jgi:hypothetical protein
MCYDAPEMDAERTPARIPDLYRSAFWIYGITVTVMREPIGVVLRHAATAGWSDSVVQQEGLRTLVVLMLMARQFLAAGIHFDRVYLEPDSAERFTRRSYPFDFLFGMGELLMAVAASMIVALPSHAFDACVGLSLVSEGIWLAASRVGGYSTVRMIAPGAARNAVSLAVCAGVRIVSSESIAAAVLLALDGAHVAHLIRESNRS